MPTPVSALIHAATMVTAGVYLLMRSSPLIEYSSTVLIICLWLGAITTVFSSLIGLFQQDIKKIIAYSTMSQLGMMVIAVGLSCYNIALFHLVNHAFYKALLFLGAGSVIHAVADNQDFRKYGGLRPFLPLTYSVMLIASLSLVAFPFMTGFYSKDLILESAYGQYYFSSTVVYFIATIGAMFTTLYSVKVLYLTFLTNPNGPLINYKNAHEGDIFMSLPLMILAVFSIFFGFITKDMFIGLGSGFFSDNALFIHPYNEILLDTEFGVPTLFKLLPLIFTISLSVIAIVLSEYLPLILIYFKLSRVGYNIFSFFNQRLLIELFYNRFITGVVLKLGGQTTKVLDKGSIEYLGPYGLEKGLLNISKNISNLNTGVITSYALYIVVSLILYIFFNTYLNGAIIILIILTSLSLGFIYFDSIALLNKLEYNFNSNLKKTMFLNSDFGSLATYEWIDYIQMIKNFQEHRHELFLEFKEMMNDMHTMKEETNNIIRKYSIYVLYSTNPDLVNAWTAYLSEIGAFTQKLNDMRELYPRGVFNINPYGTFEEKTAFIIKYAAKYDIFFKHLGPFLDGNEYNLVETSKDTMSRLTNDFTAYKEKCDVLNKATDSYLNYKQNPIQSAIRQLVEDTRPFN